MFTAHDLRAELTVMAESNLRRIMEEEINAVRSKISEAKIIKFFERAASLRSSLAPGPSEADCLSGSAEDVIYDKGYKEAAGASQYLGGHDKLGG